ncbi:MAG TPA: nuclear transport factor 2 family protein [Jatrophihabitantaceae bacterium]|jgi:ketosteroid isomerase-like protein|nr:nuclear transport factor 2 family protein [Jatrophihabitantaceae bacterium]
MTRVRETDGEVAAAVRAMYAAYPDSDRFDQHLHPDITIWETDHPGDWIGLTELTELRTRRRADAAGSPAPQLSVDQLLVDRWGESAAVARYLLRADAAGEQTAFRVTDVWDADGDGGWRIVHHHAEQL